MIDPDRRSAIYQLHQTGVPLREISRLFSISRNTVRGIIQRQGAIPDVVRKDKIQIDPELLQRVYQECEGFVERVHEKLIEEEGIEVSYPTLTRIVREMGLSRRRRQKARCDRVPDEPGAEMQHDTSDYHIGMAGCRTKVIASLIYLRYSKLRYLKFYRVFNRFAMKCFLHEALMFWGYAAKSCIIDNTNLARLRGTGKHAIMVPEMATFAERYGFQFHCHEVGHSDRKAGNERSFWTVETNFLKGRSFDSLEDLNQQAFEWATVRMLHRRVSKTGLIPAVAFEHERGYLHPLADHLPAPYREHHERGVDQYGYVAFDGNYYWVPGTGREAVKVLEYADRLKIFRRRSLLVEYPLPAWGVKQQPFSPEGQPPPRQAPKNRKRDSAQEEKRLRAMGSEVEAYLDYAWKVPGIQRHRFARELFALSRKVTDPVFLQTVERARRYRITSRQTLERIAWFCMSQSQVEYSQEPQPDVDEHYHQRPAYQEGHLTDEPDLSIYDRYGDEETDSTESDSPESEQEHG
jgi:transposase